MTTAIEDEDEVSYYNNELDDDTMEHLRVLITHVWYDFLYRTDDHPDNF
jgi:hypothetical protein